MTHENVTFNDNGTLTMIPKHPLVWVPELSEGHAEDDLLILPNIALLVSKVYICTSSVVMLLFPRLEIRDIFPLEITPKM